MTPPHDRRVGGVAYSVLRRVLALVVAGADFASLVGGRLVASDRWGIALQDLNGRVSKVLWPNGFRGVQDGERLTLVDGTGRVVAQIGDTIRSGGGFVGANGDPDNTMLVCEEIEVIQP